MLNQITLTNFRQFDHKVVTLGAGNTALRGANEAGKTTIIEGVMYAMRGIKGCRNNDITRWGEKPNSTKVEVVMSPGGQKIRVTRSPKGAELYSPFDAAKPTIVGQSEVTAELAKLYGTSMEMAGKMMFVGQKEIGGLLDESGSSKVVDFIEQMSGLDIVEWLIERAKTGNLYGPTDTLDSQIAEQASLVSTLESVDYGSSIRALEQRVEPLQQQFDTLDGAIANLAPEAAEVSTQLEALEAHASRTLQGQARVDTRREALNEATAALERHKSAPPARTLEQVQADRVELDARVAENLRIADHARALEHFGNYRPPESEWEGQLAGLQRFIDEHQAAIETLGARASTIRAQIKGHKDKATQLRASVVALGQKCPTCKQVIPDAAGVEEHNAQLEKDAVAELAQIKPLEDELAEVGVSLAEARESAAAGREIAALRVYQPVDPALVKFDDAYYPPRPEWTGGPARTIDETVQARAVELDQEADAIKRYNARLDNLQTQLEHAQKQYDVENSQLQLLTASRPKGEVGQLRDKLAALRTEIDQNRTKQGELRAEIAGIRGELTGARAAAARHQDDLSNAHTQLGLWQLKVQQIAFNNGLIDSLRRARPIVANELWNTVLHGVTTYLTQMRGEASVVTREGKTFMVNGKPYTSYSGSAVDLLALGIRIALTKVFVPGADMLIMDEPFAACTTERTMQGLALATSAGFAQTIVITHEDATEQVFDTIVEL